MLVSVEYFPIAFFNNTKFLCNKLVYKKSSKLRNAGLCSSGIQRLLGPMLNHFTCKAICRTAYELVIMNPVRHQSLNAYVASIVRTLL